MHITEQLGFYVNMVMTQMAVKIKNSFYKRVNSKTKRENPDCLLRN